MVVGTKFMSKRGLVGRQVEMGIHPPDQIVLASSLLRPPTLCLALHAC